PEDLEGAGYRLSYGGTEPYFADETGLYAAGGQVCGWQDSAMILSEFSEFIVVSRERLVCLLPNRLVDGMYDVWLLSAPDEGEKIERYEISVAITASNYTVEIAAANFNRLSDKYRVIISDYTGYNTVNDITAGRARLDRDLTTGAIPDIMTIDPEMDWRRYVSKEMFVDLYELMDSDGEFNRSSILGMLLRLCEYRGSLYYLPDSFYINTLITHGSTGITSFTLSDAISAQKKLKDDDRLFPRSFTTPYLQSQGIIMADEPLLWSAACSFIDFDGAVCCLDSAAFVEYLDFMKGLYDADAALVRSGKLSDQWRQSLSDKALSGEIVYNPYMIGRDYPGANVFAYLGYIYDNSYNIAGYPSNDKNGSLITLGNMFAVSKNANSVDGAWSFIKYYFGDKYQNMAVQSDYALSCYPLPSAVSAFDAALEKSLNSVYEVYGRIGNMAPGGAIVALDGYPDDDSEHTIYTMSAQTVRTLTDFVNSAEVIPLINNDIMGILKEELISCFAGSIDTRSAAGRMQNRVSIYLSEQS
ncbi:MAG: ABC transporter substrate-binding protein, partial [Eubacteriales bacterium]|nr:ABC transporter substrate-binding protein [Eubacteriales bacterium]